VNLEELKAFQEEARRRREELSSRPSGEVATGLGSAPSDDSDLFNFSDIGLPPGHAVAPVGSRGADDGSFLGDLYHTASSIGRGLDSMGVGLGMGIRNLSGDPTLYEWVEDREGSARARELAQRNPLLYQGGEYGDDSARDFAQRSPELLREHGFGHEVHGVGSESVRPRRQEYPGEGMLTREEFQQENQQRLQEHYDSLTRQFGQFVADTYSERLDEQRAKASPRLKRHLDRRVIDDPWAMVDPWKVANTVGESIPAMVTIAAGANAMGMGAVATGLTMAAGEGVMSGLDTQAGIEARINELGGLEPVAKEYQRARQLLGDQAPEELVQKYALENLSKKNAALAGTITALVAIPSGIGLSELLQNGTRKYVGDVMAQAAMEGGEEFFQSGGEGYFSASAAKAARPKSQAGIDPWHEALAGGLEGVAPGAVMGGGQALGAMGYRQWRDGKTGDTDTDTDTTPATDDTPPNNGFALRGNPEVSSDQSAFDAVNKELRANLILDEFGPGEEQQAIEAITEKLEDPNLSPQQVASLERARTALRQRVEIDNLMESDPEAVRILDPERFADEIDYRWDQQSLERRVNDSIAEIEELNRDVWAEENMDRAAPRGGYLGPLSTPIDRTPPKTLGATAAANTPEQRADRLNAAGDRLQRAIADHAARVEDERAAIGMAPGPMSSAPLDSGMQPGRTGRSVSGQTSAGGATERGRLSSLRVDLGDQPQGPGVRTRVDEPPAEPIPGPLDIGPGYETGEARVGRVIARSEEIAAQQARARAEEARRKAEEAEEAARVELGAERSAGVTATPAMPDGSEVRGRRAGETTSGQRGVGGTTERDRLNVLRQELGGAPRVPTGPTGAPSSPERGTGTGVPGAQPQTRQQAVATKTAAQAERERLNDLRRELGGVPRAKPQKRRRAVTTEIVAQTEDGPVSMGSLPVAEDAEAEARGILEADPDINRVELRTENGETQALTREDVPLDREAVAELLAEEAADSGVRPGVPMDAPLDPLVDRLREIRQAATPPEAQVAQPVGDEETARVEAEIEADVNAVTDQDLAMAIGEESSQDVPGETAKPGYLKRKDGRGLIEFSSPAPAEAIMRQRGLGRTHMVEEVQTEDGPRYRIREKRAGEQSRDEAEAKARVADRVKQSMKVVQGQLGRLPEGVRKLAKRLLSAGLKEDGSTKRRIESRLANSVISILEDLEGQSVKWGSVKRSFTKPGRTVWVADTVAGRIRLTAPKQGQTHWVVEYDTVTPRVGARTGEYTESFSTEGKPETSLDRAGESSAMSASNTIMFSLRRAGKRIARNRRANRITAGEVRDIGIFGDDVTQNPDGSVTVNTPSGTTLRILQVPTVSTNEVVIEVAPGKTTGAPKGTKVAGLVQLEDGVYTIRVTRDAGDVWTLGHEALHVLRAAKLITPAEYAQLVAEVKRQKGIGAPTEEDVADFVEERIKARKLERERGPIATILQKLRDIASSIASLYHKRQGQAIIRDIESGKIIRREMVTMPDGTRIPKASARDWAREHGFYSTLERKLEDIARGSKRMPVRALADQLGQWKVVELEERENKNGEMQRVQKRVVDTYNMLDMWQANQDIYTRNRAIEDEMADDKARERHQEKPTFMLVWDGKGGVKASEIEDTGLIPWMRRKYDGLGGNEKRKASLDEVLEFVRNDGYVLSEAVLGAAAGLEPFTDDELYNIGVTARRIAMMRFGIAGVGMVAHDIMSLIDGLESGKRSSVEGVDVGQGLGLSVIVTIEPSDVLANYNNIYITFSDGENTITQNLDYSKDNYFPKYTERRIKARLHDDLCLGLIARHMDRNEVREQWARQSEEIAKVMIESGPPSDSEMEHMIASSLLKGDRLDDIKAIETMIEDRGTGVLDELSTPLFTKLKKRRTQRAAPHKTFTHETGSYSVFLVGASTHGRAPVADTRGHFRDGPGGQSMHIRTGDVEIDGKRTLIVEEVQSDAFQEEAPLTGDAVRPPFRDNWQEVALRRMVHHAVKNGYDAIALTDARTQINRYTETLRAAVRSIQFRQGDISADGGPTHRVVHIDRVDGGVIDMTVNGEGVVTGTMGRGPEGLIGAKLVDVVGGTVAKQIMDEESGTIERDDLAIGGEGFRVNYDVKLPRIMDGILKKADKKSPRGRKQAFGFEKNANKGDQTWIWELTDKAKDSILERGQPLYSLRHVSEPDPIAEAFDMEQQPGSMRQALRAVASVGQRLNKDGLDDFITDHIDDLHPLRAVGENPYRRHRMLRSLNSSWEALMKFGMLQVKDGGLVTKPGTQGFAQWTKQHGDDVPNALAWMLVKRAERLDSVGREKWLTETKRNKIMKRLSSGPKKAQSWEWLAEQIMAYHRSVLDIALAQGTISRDEYVKWADEVYVPMFRILEDDALFDKYSASTNKQHLSRQIFRLVGKDVKIGNPMENMVRNWYNLIRIAQENGARASVVDTAIEQGLTGAILDENGQSVPLVEELSFQDVHTFRTLPKKGKGKTRVTMVSRKTGQNDVFSFFRNGKRVYYRVNDASILGAMLGGVAPSGMLVNAMRAAKRALTYGATHVPGFVLVNATRDAWHVASVERDYRILRDTANGFRHVLSRSDTYKKAAAAGGLFAGSYSRADAGVDSARIINRSLNKEGIVLSDIRKIWGLWEFLVDASENATRVGLYARLEEKGISDGEAAFRMRDVLDFTKRGGATYMGYILAMYPFLNARMQGLAALGEAAHRDPKNVATKIAMLTLAGVGLWMAGAGDPEHRERYDRLEDWEKYTYWNFWIGDTHVRIPKPFELGIASTWAEAALEDLDRQDGEGRFMKSLGFSIQQTLAIDPIPQLIRPTFELATDTNRFTKRPVEGPTLERLPGEMRARPWTSETAQAVGGVTGKAGLSPVRIEHLVQGYFGGLGRAAMSVADAMVSRPLGDFPVPPAKSLGERTREITGLYRFVPTNTSGVNTRQLTMFYEAHAEIQEVVNGINAARKIGDFDMANDMMRDNRDLLAWRRAFGGAAKQLSNINAQTRRIWYSRNLSAEQKREQIDDLNRRKADIAQGVWDRYRNYKQRRAPQ
jgi:hypothetical protein